MKTKIFALVLCLLSTIAFSQVTKKALELPEFKGIYVNSNYTVYLKQTNKQEVSVEALTEIFSVSDIKVVDGILMINIERKPESPNKSLWAKIDDIKLNPTMKLFITMKNIEELQVNGGGKIIAENSLATGIPSVVFALKKIGVVLYACLHPDLFSDTDIAIERDIALPSFTDPVKVREGRLISRFYFLL